jgi:EAL domain-containing protein (putative c-di-GMP-specific phosphodiesterase class I)
MAVNSTIGDDLRLKNFATVASRIGRLSQEYAMTLVENPSDDVVHPLMGQVASAKATKQPLSPVALQSSPVSFEDLLDRRHLKPAYQSIFNLTTGEEVAAEALARWPDLAVTPDLAFRSATAQGRLAELDEACRYGAIDGAIAFGLPSGFKLFVNLEPSVLGADTAAGLVSRAASQVDLMVEITERALTRRPAELLRAVEELRAAGCAIALDDVGAEPESLALLPFIAPDVIKLDISLVQRWLNVEQASIYTAVAAYAERTGATILAEGIETETDLEQALALGATLGQGWYFSRPGPLKVRSSPEQPHRVREAMPTPLTPFSLLDPSAIRTGPKGLLLGISRHMENQGLALQTPPVVLGAFQEARHFTPHTAARYSQLAERCPLVAALGVNLPQEPVAGVRGASLQADDHLLGEWVVVVVGTHYAGALIAKDLGDTGPDRDRRFAFALTHDHETVLAAARSLITRVIATSSFPESESGLA